MPDPSDRIRLSSIEAMHNILLTFQSFDPETDPSQHPKIMIIFNNVSKLLWVPIEEELNPNERRINEYR